MDERAATIEELNLDLENPRFAGFQSNREALVAIIADQGSKLYELAKDIASEGLSPAHRIIAIQGGSKKSYVVVDGNRRLAALKILINPSVVDTVDGINSHLKKQYKALAENFDRAIVEPVNIALIPSRDEANRWIDFIHTGENKGRGVVEWDGVARDRFRGKSPSYQVLQLLRKAGQLSDEQFEKFPITNLARLLSTPEVRASLGITYEEGRPKLLFAPESLIPLLSHVVNELASGNTTVSNIKSKEERIAFAEKLPKRLKPKNPLRLDNPVSIEDALGLLGQRSATKVKQRSASATKILRKTLIPKRCRLTIENQRIDQIVSELKRLQLDTTPNACAVLLRVFIELSMDAYGKKEKIAGYNADKLTLENKLTKVADYLQENGLSKNDLHSFRRAANNSTSPLYVDRLHKFVHNLHALPTASELRTGWDEVQHVFERIWS